MFYLKLKCKVSFKKNGKHVLQKNDVAFALPINAYLTGTPDNIKKPVVMINKTVGSAMQGDIYQVHDEKVIYVKTEIDIDNWTGRTYRYKVASCSCKGHRYYSFDTLEILTEEEYNNLKL